MAGAAWGSSSGLVLAELMALQLRTIAAVPFERADPQPASVVAVVLIGLGVTLAAGLEPARRAGSIPPVEALRERGEPSSRGGPGSAGSSPCSWPSASRACSSGRATSAGTGSSARPPSTCVLFGAVLLAPIVLGALGRVAGLPFRLVFRPEERLARAAIARDRGRTTLTVGALAVGLAMVVAVGGGRPPVAARGGGLAAAT